MTNLNFEIAQRHTKSFLDNVMHEHHDAMACYECDEMLAAGIKAFEWICIAEKTIREADLEGLLEDTANFEEKISALYESWFKPVQLVEGFIKRVKQNGFDLENLARFEEIKQEADDRVAQLQFVNASRRCFFDSIIKEE